MYRFKLICLLAAIGSLTSCEPASTPTPSNPVSKRDTVMKDVAYGSSSKQNMDIYLPEDRNNSTKIIILVHGGAWSAGDKNEMNILIPKIQKDWPEAAIVNMNYRLANGADVVHTQISEDMDAAVDFIAAQKSAYQISDTMFMLGASAGAHLSLLYAYRDNDEKHVKAVSNLFGPSIFADWEMYNSFNPLLGGPVKNVWINYTGTSWDSTLYKSLSPYHIASATTSVPTISFHGGLDPIVPVYQNRWFHAHLISLGISSAYHEYPADFHGFSDGNYNDCIRKSVAFFKESL